MQLENYIDKNLLRLNFRAKSKEEALRGIAGVAVQSPLLKDFPQDLVYQKLVERENVVSTGVGDGVALPHVRLEGLSEFIVFCLVVPEGVDFDALDGRKVKVFFPVLAPVNQVNEHLRILARIAYALGHTHMKKELLNTTHVDVLHEVILRYLAEEPRKPAPLAKKKLLMIVLYYEDMLDEVLQYLVERQIDGATIISSEGMGARVSHLPLFAGFLDFMKKDAYLSHTVLALIPSEEEQDIISGIEAVTGDIDTKQGAFVMTLDLAFYKGSMSML